LVRAIEREDEVSVDSLLRNMDKSIAQDKTFWFLMKEKISNVSLCLKVMDIYQPPDDFIIHAMRDDHSLLIAHLLNRGIKIPNDIAFLNELIRKNYDVFAMRKILMDPGVVFDQSYLLSAVEHPEMFNMLMNHPRCGATGPISSSIMIELLQKDIDHNLLVPKIRINDHLIRSIPRDRIEFLMRKVGFLSWEVTDGYLMEMYWNHPEFKQFITTLIAKLDIHTCNKIIASMIDDSFLTEEKKEKNHDLICFMFLHIPYSSLLFGFKCILDKPGGEELGCQLSHYLIEIGSWISYAITKKLFSLATHLVRERMTYDPIDQQEINRIYLLSVSSDSEADENMRQFVKLLFDENLISDEIIKSNRKQTPDWVMKMVKDKDSIDQQRISNVIAILEKIKMK